MKKLTQKTICEAIDQILDDYVNGIDISYSEIVFLQEHTDTIKKHYKNEPALWELAGIPETEWNNQQNQKDA